MYRWTDSDVEAMISLVLRSVQPSDGPHQSWQQCLQELAKLLEGPSWRLEMGVIDKKSPRQPTTLRTLCSGLEPADHFRCQSAAARRDQARCFLRDSAMARLAPLDLIVNAAQCACRGEDRLHPIIACMSFNADGEWCYVEYDRAVGQDEFTARHEAMLRVLLRQMDLSSEPQPVSMLRPAASKELSRRQREVLDLLLAGKNGKQIAAELQLSVYTVNDYIKAIYRRYEVSSRAELLAAVHVGI